LNGQRIAGSFDKIANAITGMLDFTNGGSTPAVLLDTTKGTVK
jgi:hypothetical protein